jgi:hypothetical protein
LTLRAGALLSQEIMILTLTGVKALVALFHERQNIVRTQLVALRPGQCIGASGAVESPGTYERHCGDRARSS